MEYRNDEGICPMYVPLASLVTCQNRNFRVRSVFDSGVGGHLLGGKEEEGLAIGGDLGRTIGPERFDFLKPVAELTAKKAIGRVFDGAELVGEPGSGTEPWPPPWKKGGRNPSSGV
jgi:hypothetical protein